MFTKSFKKSKKYFILKIKIDKKDPPSDKTAVSSDVQNRYIKIYATIRSLA